MYSHGKKVQHVWLVKVLCGISLERGQFPIRSMSFFVKKGVTLGAMYAKIFSTLIRMNEEKKFENSTKLERMVYLRGIEVLMLKLLRNSKLSSLCIRKFFQSTVFGSIQIEKKAIGLSEIL